MARELLAASPQAAYWAWANREFVARAVRFAVGAGVRQILDIGCGLLARAGSVHQVAWSVAPDTRVAYVDNDPVVVAAAEAAVAGQGGVAVACADLRDPDTIVGHPGLGAVLDWSRPVVVLAAAVLHFVSDEDDPAGVVARLRDAAAPGSYLVISHACEPAEMTEQQEKVLAAYNEQTAPLRLRSRDEIERLFTGWRLVAPGLVRPAHWRPDAGELDDPEEAARAAQIPGWVGVAVKDGMTYRAGGLAGAVDTTDTGVTGDGKAAVVGDGRDG
jgi:SAM-dependent methyltransferase